MQIGNVVPRDLGPGYSGVNHQLMVSRDWKASESSRDSVWYHGCDMEKIIDIYLLSPEIF